MKIVFSKNKTADISAIQSVSVIKASKRIEVCVKHKTEKMGKQEVSYLAYPCLSYSRRHLLKLAKIIAKELEDLSKAPDSPIERVIKLIAWAWGYLQVKLDINNDASVQGLAPL